MEKQAIKIIVQRSSCLETIIPEEIREKFGLILEGGISPRESETIELLYQKDVETENARIKAAIEEAVPGIILEVSDR